MSKKPHIVYINVRIIKDLLVYDLINFEHDFLDFFLNSDKFSSLIKIKVLTKNSTQKRIAVSNKTSSNIKRYADQNKCSVAVLINTMINHFVNSEK